MFLTSSVMAQVMARFRNLLQPIKSQDLIEKKAQKAQCVSNGCKDLFKQKTNGG